MPGSRLWAVVVLSFGLSACGGGGGGGGGDAQEAPSPPALDPMGATAAARFLTQATFGPTLAEIQALGARFDFENWFAAQRAAPVSLEYPAVRAVAAPGEFVDPRFRMEKWFRDAVQGQDQLRQRMAFALSEILVVSDVSGALENEAPMLAAYNDILARNALGNFRTLLGEVTLSQAMGHYLSMFQNQKPDPADGIRADENYAREIMQLFTVGLENLNSDGSGRGTPTYTQADVENLARVFTGWSYPNGTRPDSFYFVRNAPSNLPMQAYPSFHDTDAKTILGGTLIPAGQTPQQDLDQALDTLFNHPNVGPFIGRQLIQRLVTSNPSPMYVQRVAAVFDNNGSGVRGDLYAVSRAILLDTEARQGHLASPQTFGKVREPLIRVTHLWRAFSAVNRDGRVEYEHPQEDLGQAPMRSPSVFNFFRPRYQPGGPITEQGLVAPEFQIINENTVTSTTNRLGTMASLYRSTGGGTARFASRLDVAVNYTPWEARAADVPGLISDLDLVFLAGQMSDAMRSSLVTYVSQMPANDPGARVYEAVNLIIGSPQYAVQR